MNDGGESVGEGGISGGERSKLGQRIKVAQNSFQHFPRHRF